LERVKPVDSNMMQDSQFYIHKESALTKSITDNGSGSEDERFYASNMKNR
jgi:hypothetical protein